MAASAAAHSAVAARAPFAASWTKRSREEPSPGTVCAGVDQATFQILDRGASAGFWQGSRALLRNAAAVTLSDRHKSHQESAA